MLAAYSMWIGESLAQGESVTLYGTGTFTASFRVGRKIYHRQAGKFIKQKSAYIPKFRPSPRIKKALQKLAENPSPSYFAGWMVRQRKGPSADVLARDAERKRRRDEAKKNQVPSGGNRRDEGIQDVVGPKDVQHDAVAQGVSQEADAQHQPDSGRSGGTDDSASGGLDGTGYGQSSLGQPNPRPA